MHALGNPANLALRWRTRRGEERRRALGVRAVHTVQNQQVPVRIKIQRAPKKPPFGESRGV